MSRKACKRRVRRAVEPAMVKLANIPEIGIGERTAIEALRGGYAEYQHYRTLADCHGHLMLAASKRHDDDAKAICQLGYVAMLNIYDRYQKTRRYGATGDELQSLIAMLDFSDDFWRRQSGALLDECIAINSEIRRRQLAESRKKAA